MLVVSGILLWLCLTISTSLGNNQGNVCPNGRYWNDFVIGCVPCPKVLKQCTNDQIDDANRCFRACRQIVTTTAPTSHGTSESKTFTSPLHKVTQSTGIMETTQGYTPRDEQSGQNWTEITVGILFSVMALFVLMFVAIFFAAYRKERRPAKSNGCQRKQTIYYSHDRLNSRSNCEQGISCPGKRLQNTNEEAPDAENINSSSITIPSVSHEDFSSIPVSQV